MKMGNWNARKLAASRDQMLMLLTRQVLAKLPGLRRAAASACIIFVFASPVAAQGVSCTYPEKPTLEIDLMFGRNIGHVLGVSEESWDDFVAKEIVPRFDSFTVLDAVGYWQGSKELSKRVLISPKPEDKAVQKEIDDIVAAYRRRFRQDSVDVFIQHGCGSFCRPSSYCTKTKSEKPPKDCLTKP